MIPYVWVLKSKKNGMWAGDSVKNIKMIAIIINKGKDIPLIKPLPLE